MSRIGKQPITIPAGVTVEIGAEIKVSGPKGQLTQPVLPGLKLEQADGQLTISVKRGQVEALKTWGLLRTLIDNMIKGVTDGFDRQLEVNGVGYRAAVNGNQITLNLGFSHPVSYDLPEGISAKVEKNIITISGHDKQLVGQVAANLRALKKPEPYKGKGIKYIDETIRRKAGKAATKG